MADITITPSNVFKGPSAVSHVATADGAITAGMPVGRTNLGKFGRILANVAVNGCNGIALCDCADGQVFIYVESDTALDLGLTSADRGKNIFISENGLTFNIEDVAVSGNQIMTIGNVNTDGTVTLNILNGTTLP